MRTDVLIIGCGIAGATAALRLARAGVERVTLLTRAAEPGDSNSSLAQGGMVGRGPEDSPELLERDILEAGAGLCNPPAVRLLAREGPGLIEEILVDAAAVEFDRDEEGKPAFGLEAAHSCRRILHAGDRTGKALMAGLLRAVAAEPAIEVLPQHTAVDLLTFPHHSLDPLARYHPPSCHGVYAFVQRTGRVKTIVARRTILATGGLGQIFMNTTNPTGARGDGLAMAYRAGARVINAEYVQFHPTALHMAGTTKALISEAVRGEGAVLLTPNGERFMHRYSAERGELDTRDVVARAIYAEMVNHDYPYVLLDIASCKPREFIRERFPGILELCRQQNLDMSRRPIPVVPAAHYFCGGVLVDTEGRSTLPGLYALGEVACSGVHGANRLASTSLLEGLVWGARAANAVRSDLDHTKPIDDGGVPPWDDADQHNPVDPALIQGDMQTIRTLMWHYVGLIRNEYRLNRAVRELRDLWQNIEDFYRKSQLSDSLIGLRNSILNGLVVGRAALRNPASRGCHFREDHRPVLRAAPPDLTH